MNMVSARRCTEAAQHAAHPVGGHLVAGHILRRGHVLQADHARRPLVARALVEVQRQQQRLRNRLDHVRGLQPLRLVDALRDAVGLRQQQLAHLGDQVPHQRRRDHQRLRLTRRAARTSFASSLVW